MKKTVYIIAALLFPIVMFSQETEEKEKFYKVNKPVRPGFESGAIMDGQTTYIPTAKTMEFMMQHRFAPMGNGIKDLFGIYGPGANIRLGMNYSITDYIMVGYGIMKYNMVSDFQLKVNILKQTRNNKIPLDVTFYGNLAIDGQNESRYGMNYSFANRFSYFSELMIARKFGSWLACQVGGSFTHFNAAELGKEHDKIALHLVVRAKFSPQSAIVLNYDWPLLIDGIAENLPMYEPPRPNLCIGYEVATSTHSFQVYIGTSNWIVPQYIVMNNREDWTKGEFIIGFNITRLWSF